MLKILTGVGKALSSPLNKLMAMGAVAALTVIGLFYWQLNSLQDNYDATAAELAVANAKSTSLQQELVISKAEFDRKTAANLWWQKEHKKLDKALAEERAAYREALANEDTKTQDCLATPLSDPLFNSITGRL